MPDRDNRLMMGRGEETGRSGDQSDGEKPEEESKGNHQSSKEDCEDTLMPRVQPSGGLTFRCRFRGYRLGEAYTCLAWIKKFVSNVQSVAFHSKWTFLGSETG